MAGVKCVKHARLKEERGRGIYCVESTDTDWLAVSSFEEPPKSSRSRSNQTSTASLTTLASSEKLSVPLQAGTPSTNSDSGSHHTGLAYDASSRALLASPRKFLGKTKTGALSMECAGVGLLEL